MDTNALFRLSYGLFLLTAREGDFDNGCIVNTVSQVTDRPLRISVTVNKENKTCRMIQATGKFNASILDATVPFPVFQHFGFQSGREVDKFAGWNNAGRSGNGLLYLTKFACAYLSGQVVQQVDLGTHILFVADLTDGEILSQEPPVTYADYHARIKPQPAKPAGEKKAWRCRICGYVYEGEQLPPDFVCPICKHGAEDFEPI